MMRTKKNILFLFLIMVPVFILYKNLPGTPPLTWEEGARQMYRVNIRTVMRASQPGSQSIHEAFELRGTLNFRIYERDKESIRAGFQLSPVEIRKSGRNDRAAEKLYSEIFFAEISPGGRFLHFDFSNEIAAEDEEILKDIISSFQLIVKDTLFGSWEEEEENINGRYVAEYSREKDSIGKAKKRYKVISGRDGAIKGDESIEIKRSEYRFKYGPSSSWITGASGNELVHFLSGKDPYLKVSTTAELLMIPFDPDRELAIWNDSKNRQEIVTQWQKLPKNRTSLRRGSEINSLEEKFGGRSFVEITDELFKKYHRFDIRCLQTLVEFLQLHPEAALKFPDYLRNKNLNPTQRVMLVHALERNGRADAQTALMEIVTGTEFKYESRIQASIAFGSIREPAEAMVNSLWDVYDNRASGEKHADKIAGTAILSLGAMAKNLEGSKDEDYRGISREIKQKISYQLDAEQDINTRVALLHAAGNTADESFMEQINSSLRDENPFIRSAAVSSLVYMNDDEVNRVLAGELDSEKNVNVRNTVVSTLYRKKPAQGAIEKILEKLPDEENDIVRGQMYRYLLKNRDFQGVKEKLEEMLEKESVKENRKMIHTALNTTKKAKRQ